MYGASYVVGKALSLTADEIPFTISEWTHITSAPWFSIPRARDFTGSKRWFTPSAMRRLLVSNVQDAIVAHSDGYRKAVPVGHPFLQVSGAQDNSGGDIANLFFPGHLVAEEPSNSATLSRYLRGLNVLIETAHKLSGFSLFCLHGEDAKWREITRALEAEGIPWVVGAQVNDWNSYPRLRALLSRASHVYTNSFGTHILLAWYCAVPVTLIADADPYDPDWTFKSRWSKARPKEYLRRFFEKREEVLKEYFSKMGSTYTGLDREAAATFLGVESKKSPQFLAELLGWKRSSITIQTHAAIRSARDSVARVRGRYVDW